MLTESTKNMHTFASTFFPGFLEANFSELVNQEMAPFRLSEVFLSYRSSDDSYVVSTPTFPGMSYVQKVKPSDITFYPQDFPYVLAACAGHYFSNIRESVDAHIQLGEN